MTPATCCTKLCNFFATFWLQIFNFLDLTIGTLLVVVACYIRLNIADSNGNPHEHRVLIIVGWVSFMLGLMFILVSLFSFCGIVSVSFRFAVVPSGYLALVLAVCALAGGILSIVCDEDILEFIDNNKHKLNMRPEHVRMLHVFYDIVTISLFASFVIEITRFMLSSQYTVTADLIDKSTDIEGESLLRASSHYQADYQHNSRYDPYQKRINNSGYGGAAYNRGGDRDGNVRSSSAYYRDRVPPHAV